MKYDEYKTIRVDKNGSVATIWLNRPDSFNAINGDLHEELARIFTDISDDDEVRVAILAGAGRHFSAGGDMEWLEALIDHPQEWDKVARHGRRIIHTMLDCPKPILAKLQGAAVGLGATIALLSDIIIASDRATIADPHVRIGFVAGDGGALIWPQLIGFARAKEYLLTGDPISAMEAERIGLINKVVAPENLDAAVNELAKRLSTGPRSAIEGTKRAVNLTLKHLAHTLMDASLSFECESNRSRDHREGVAAFKEKRTPTFTGE